MNVVMLKDDKDGDLDNWSLGACFPKNVGNLFDHDENHMFVKEVQFPLWSHGLAIVDYRTETPEDLTVKWQALEGGQATFVRGDQPWEDVMRLKNEVYETIFEAPNGHSRAIYFWSRIEIDFQRATLQTDDLDDILIAYYEHST